MGYFTRCAKAFLATASFASCLLGCSSQADIARRVESSIGSFERGSTQEARESARDIAHADESMSAFLLYQYSLFNSIKNNDAKAVIDAPSGTLGETGSKFSSNYRGAMITARTFALYAAGKELAAKHYLGDECKKWRGYGATACANHILGEALGRYYAVHEKLAAVYLYESSYIFERVVHGKAVGGEFYRALALIEIDNEQASSAIRALIDHKQFNVVMAQQYCGFMSATPYKRIVDCNKVPEANQDLRNGDE